MTAPTDSPDRDDTGPGVITFPPVIFGIFFVMGYVTDRAVPIALGMPLLREGAGDVAIGLAICLVVWAGGWFRRARTHIDVRKPATSLVTDGPYRFTRNPMYLAATLLYAGICLRMSLGWTLAALVPCLIAMHYGVIRREERYLERKFGEAYREYRSRVRRWI